MHRMCIAVRWLRSAERVAYGAQPIHVAVATFNSAGAPTVEFSVPDMMCAEGCAVAVKEILAKAAGREGRVGRFRRQDGDRRDRGREVRRRARRLRRSWTSGSTTPALKCRTCPRKPQATPATRHGRLIGQLLVLRAIEDRDRQHQRGRHREDRARGQPVTVEHAQCTHS